jgi:hypothetical protein
MSTGETVLGLIAVGSKLIRRYYAVPNVYDLGREFDEQSDAALFALDRWASAETDMPLQPPVIDLRWVMLSPEGGHADVLVQRIQVAPHLTSTEFASRDARARAANMAAAQIRKVQP